MNKMVWREKVCAILEEMPIGTTFFASEIASKFGPRGPTANSVGRYVSKTGLAVAATTDINKGRLWRRV